MSTHPVQSLNGFLRNKLKHGAVFQFHEVSNTVSPGQLDPLKRPKEAGLTPHRPSKRHEIDLEFEIDPPQFNLDITENPIVPAPTSAQPLPQEFQAEKFDFVPTRYTPEQDGIQTLLDVMQEDDVTQQETTLEGPEDEETKARPKRLPSRPQLYQSEEVERKEKELRKHSS
jgi:hypothetical protein